jgi:hypothetical protein
MALDPVEALVQIPEPRYQIKTTSRGRERQDVGGLVGFVAAGAAVLRAAGKPLKCHCALTQSWRAVEFVFLTLSQCPW